MRILIVHPDGNINVNSNLTAMVEVLNENGYKVDILSQRRPDINQNTNLPARLILVRTISFLLRAKIYSGVLGRILRCLIRLNGRGYGLIIGVDRDGIIAGGIISQLSGVPHALISYEILFRDEIGADYKQEEIIACQNIEFAICQDRVRSQKLCEENKIPEHKIICIPVSGRNVQRNNASLNHLRNKFCIGEECKLALYIGTISKWAGFNRIIEDFSAWPDDWVLVIHGRYSGKEQYQLVEQLKEEDKSRIFISDTPFECFDDLYKLPLSADLGMAIYCPDYSSPYTGKNLEYIGWSSGKIASYLQCGLPILVNETGLISDAVKNYDLGYVLKNDERIADKLASIDMQDLENKKKACRTFFSEKLDFEIHKNKLLELRQNTYIHDHGFYLPLTFLVALINLYHRLREFITYCKVVFWNVVLFNE